MNTKSICLELQINKIFVILLPLGQLWQMSKKGENK